MYNVVTIQLGQNNEWYDKILIYNIDSSMALIGFVRDFVAHDV